MKKAVFSFILILLASFYAKAASTVVWMGSFDTNNWSSCLDLDGSSFSSLKSGDKVVFSATLSGTAKIQLANNDWSSYIPTNEYNCEEFNGTYTVSITSSNIEFFKGGIHVKGENFTLTSVAIESESTGESGGESGGISTGTFHVSGTKLLDANGNEFVMRGCNYSYAWQKGNEGTVIPAAKRIGCNAIRLNISNGKKFTYCSESEIANLIKLCEDNKLVCVLCVHDALGTDDQSALDAAVDYWKSIKGALTGHENTVIVNIANEWVSSWESGASTWEAGYKSAIKALREAGIKNTLMVDCAGYGQYPGVIWTNGANVLAADTESNTMFSIHMYQHDASTESQVKTAIDNALGVGAPLCIGEFAYEHQGESVAYQTILDYSQEKHVGYLVWSWTGNGGGAEACDMFGSYDESQIKTNGEKTVNGTNGIKATSVECSIFGGTSTVDPSEDSAWTGSFSPASWDEYLELPASLFEGVAVGDKIQFIGMAGTNSHIQLNNADWSATIPVNTYNCDEFTGEYTVEVTEDNLSFFQGNVYVKGENFTITTVKIIKASSGEDGGESGGEGGTVTEGNVVNVWSGTEAISWSGNGVKILGYWFQDVVAGDVIQFTVTDLSTSTTSPSQLQIGNSNYQALVEGRTGQGCVDVTSSTYQLVLTDALIDEIVDGAQDGGLRIKGQNCTLTSVDIVTERQQYSYTIETVKEFQTPQDMGMWSDDALFKIEAAKFSSLGEGDRIVFQLASAEDQAQLQIAASTDWTYLRDEFKNTGVQSPMFFFTLASDEPNYYANGGGMSVKGTKCAVSSVQIWHRGSVATGIDNISNAVKDNIDFSMPYEIYTMDGKQVQSMSGKGLYILRQGKKVLKVRN